MDKIRLDFYLSVGGLLVLGDECTNVDGLVISMKYLSVVEQWNREEPDNSRCHITSFTERENKGAQPVPDGFPVVLTLKDGRIPGYKSSLAKDVDWENNYWYARWKPDYNKLLEMQKEHDLNKEFCKAADMSFNQEKPIEELMINAKESKMSDVYTQEMKDRGELVVAGMKFRDDDGYPQEAVLTTDLEVVYKIGSYVFIINQKRAMPYKSKEELEIEEAQANQVKEVSQFLRELAKSTGFNEAAKALQEKGALAEIVLPLEGE